MFSKQALIVVLATAAATMQSSDAFVSSHIQPIHRQATDSSTRAMYAADSDVAIAESYFVSEEATETSAQHDTLESEMILEISAVEEGILLEISNVEEVSAPKQADVAKKVVPKKKANPAHKTGPLSPVVLAAATVLGKDQLNKIRGKAISIHSDIIKSFVDTSDSIVGQALLKQLFALVDIDNSGYLDKDEIALALQKLGFTWLNEKKATKIFERADVNSDNEVSLEEFLLETPKTLRVNLVKLAKTNGGEMGLLV